MKKVTIKIGTVGDLDAVEIVENTCFSGCRRNSRRALRHALSSPTQHLWIAWMREPGSGKQVAGVLTLHLRRRSVRIYSLAVMPAFRGGGLGRLMVEKSIAEAKRQGVPYVSLEADRDDHRLVRWYTRFGFEVVQVLPGYYDVGQDAVRMCRVMTGTKGKEDQITA